MTDSTVKCLACDREERVSFSYCLRHGWPTCCGATMNLEGSPGEGVIEAAVSDAFAPVKDAMREAGRS